MAYVDPYLAEDGHARVLLYDVAHDKEFIAFQDLHMQVQTSADAVTIGRPRNMVVGSGTAPVDLAEYTATFNGGGPSWITTQIDVANGYPSENRYIRSTQQSKFIESAYAHDLANRLATSTLNPISLTLTDCDVNSGDATIELNSGNTLRLLVGMTISGTGIPDGTVISSITDTDTFEMSANATQSTDPATLTFGFLPDNLPSNASTSSSPGIYGKAHGS